MGTSKAEREQAIRDLAGDKKGTFNVSSVLDAFYISKQIVDTVDPGSYVNPIVLLGILELVGLAAFLSSTIFGAVVIYRDTGFRRWWWVQNIFWETLPTLSSYSAMKLLNAIVPTVATARLFELIADIQERIEEKKPKLPVIGAFIFWIFSLIFGFIAGFDTFLLKLRIVSASSTILAGAVPCIQFLIQILGVVQLGPFMRKRLFVFIFGGEDGVMQDEEVELMETWNALLARRIFRDLTPAKAVAVMMGFTDTDFQSLVLNENAAVKQAELGN